MKIIYLSYERGIELGDILCRNCKKRVYQSKKGLVHVHNQSEYCDAKKLVKAFGERKHEIMYIDFNTIANDGYQETLRKALEFQPDLVLEREFNDGKAEYAQLVADIGMKSSFAGHPVKTAVWLIDTHVSYARHKDYMQLFDYVFLAVSKFVPEFRKLHGDDKVFWLPLCFPYRSDTINFNYFPITKPVSFVGRWNKQWFPRRTYYIKRLKKMFGARFTAITDYQNMFTILKRSKVSFNCSINKDLNFRVWESLGAGTELITDDVPDLHKIDGLAPRASIYHNFNEVKEYISGIISNDPKYTHNTLTNQMYVRKNHCLVHRHKAILQMIESGEQAKF